MPSPVILSDEGKRLALERVLGSRVFSRCDQLKAFLRYAAEAEISGRGENVTEYHVAVHALGRSASFDGAFDATVRNRAFLLRNRLQRYYRGEGIGDLIRIELPKGRYCPVFYAATVSTDAPYPQPGVPDIIREAWGPLVAPEGNPLICIATPAHLALRREPTKVPARSPSSDANQYLDWYASIASLPRAENLYLRPSMNSPFWGDCAGAVSVTQVLTAAGARPELLQEMAISIPVLRNRNALLFGRTDYSKAVELFLKDTPFQLQYLPEVQEYAVLDLRGRTPTTYVPQFSSENLGEVLYGLITVMPSKSSNPGRQRTVILSGTISPGTQAAAEFFCSALRLLDLKEKFVSAGIDGFPDAYQVVVRAQVHGNMLLDVSYVAHCVLSM
jgi:hypothetical protein